MIIDKLKPSLPPDEFPTDPPPSYENLTHATFRDEDQLEYVPASSSIPHVGSSTPATPKTLPLAKSPSSSTAKGKGKAVSSWFGFLASKTARKIQVTVLGLIRDLVKEQNQSSAASLAILESCAEACCGYDLTLSSLLQEKSIEGHTPMYWAIVKRHPDDEEHGKPVSDLLTALISYATPLNPDTIADIRQACLLTSDQLLFQHLRMSPEFSPLSGTDEMLLGAAIPPDTITVKNAAKDERAFTVNFEVAHFQKRMLISNRIQLDFIARARMWRLEFLIAEPSRQRDAPRQGSWCISLSLLENSPPTWIDSRLLVPEPILTLSNTPSSPEGSSPPSSAASLVDRLRSRPTKPKPTISIRLRSPQQMAPRHTKFRQSREFCSAIIVSLDDSEMGSSLQYAGTSYIASDETLRARLEARLGRPAADSDCIIC